MGLLKRVLKNVIGKSIELLEKYEYKNLNLDESDITKKIIDTKQLSNVKVLSDTGYVPATEIHKTQPYTVYEIRTSSGKTIEGADIHLVYRQTYAETVIINESVWIKDLNVGDYILTKDGPEQVVSIYKAPYKLSMYDLSIDSQEHRYYTNDILSHNTTTVSAFLSWMLIFHADRNILVVANKEDTAIEIVDKITNIFKGLPYFLKPGCINFGKTGLRLENGSRIISSATTNTASIGFTIHCILLDEFAHIPDNIVNNFWRSVYPTLSSSEVSQCIITSTPNGTTNKFYDIWSHAIEKTNSFVPIRTDYWEVPSHDDAWAEKMRADFGDEEFAQEFELQFNINSKMLLKASDLQFMERLCVDFENKPIYGINNKYIHDENIKWHPKFDPNDIEENDKFVFLVDLAEGTEDQDKKFKNKKQTPDSNTINIFKVVPNSLVNIKKYADKSCKIIDAFRYIQVGYYECNTEDEEYCANVCSALAYDLMKDDERESVRVMVEMNFNGKSFVQTMQRHPKYYDGTILRTYHTKPVPGEKQRKRLGFKTTANKEYFCLRGAKLINMRRIVVTDTATYNQMKSFGYVKGKLKGIACHDDMSMPVFNHIPRMLVEDYFVEWLDDILMNLENESQKYAINMLIELHDMDNPEISDSEFNAMYNRSDDTFPYSETSQSMNPYSENNVGGFGSYSGGLSGFGQGLSPYASPYNPYMK